MLKAIRKKANILLLEILVALAIVSMCAIPIARQPIRYFKMSIKAIHKMESERIAELSCLEIKEKLYNNEISWDRLPKGRKNTLFIPLSPHTLKVDAISDITLQRKIHLWWNHEKKGANNLTYRLLHIVVQLDQQNGKKANSSMYKYRVMIQKSSLSGADSH